MLLNQINFKYTLPVVLLLFKVLVHCFPTNIIENDKIYRRRNYDNIFSELLKSNKSITTASNYTTKYLEILESNSKISPFKCGIRNMNSYLSPRILSDSRSYETEINEFPWQIALLLDIDNNGGVMYNGGGSIIHPSIVITVAHRVYNQTANKLKIRAGQWNLLENEEINQRQDRSVSNIIVHENFILTNYINDIALLILEKPFVLTLFVSPVCLIPENMNFQNNLCTASGWGKNKYDKNGEYQKILKKIDLRILPNNQCQNFLRIIGINEKFVKSSFICAGGETGMDTCTGDGGSALVCPTIENSNRYYQVGIVAAGFGCGLNGIPGLYTNIANMRSWIDEQVLNQGFDKLSYTFNENNDLVHSVDVRS